MSDEYFMPQDHKVLGNLAEMGQRLKQLRDEMYRKELEYKAAKDEYNNYAGSVLPASMLSAGLTSIELLDGSRIVCEHKYQCAPNKNPVDRGIIVAWLKSIGGEDLVKTRAKVDGAQLDGLRAAGIPYEEESDINTNSLKAFIKSKLGAGAGMAELTLEDIPACVHFTEFVQVEIEDAKS